MKSVLLLLVNFLLVSLESVLLGQTTFGVIRGTVRDSADAVMVGLPLR